MPDPSQYTDNIQGAIAAFKAAGSPQASLPDIQQVVQANYDKLNASGYLASGDGQALGHVLRQNWNVSDPTQGGQVKPPTPAASPAATLPPQAMPAAAPAASAPPPVPAPTPAAPPLDPAQAAPTPGTGADPASAPAPPGPAAPDPIGDAFTLSDKATAAYQAQPTPSNLIAYKDALQNTVNVVVGTGAMARHQEYQDWAKSLQDSGLVVVPQLPPAPAGDPNQQSMSEAPKLSPLQQLEQTVSTDAEAAKEGVSHWWQNVTGGLQGVRDELADPTDSANQSLHFGQVGAGLMDFGKNLADAVPDVAKSVYRHAIGQGDDYDVQQADARASDSLAQVAGAPLIAAMPFGLRQATDAMGAYADGDKAKALTILKAAPGQIGAYARENKLETALMLLPVFLHGAASVREATAGRASALAEVKPQPGVETPAETPPAPRSAAVTPPVEPTQAVSPPLPAEPARSTGGVPLGRQKPALGNPVQAAAPRPVPAVSAEPPAAETPALLAEAPKPQEAQAATGEDTYKANLRALYARTNSLPEPLREANIDAAWKTYQAEQASMQRLKTTTPQSQPQPVAAPPAADAVPPAAASPETLPPARVAEETDITQGTGTTFTPTTNDLKPAPQKMDAKTGMTSVQKQYLSDALTNYAASPEANNATDAPAPPHTIEVPGDGRYTVDGVVQANALHVNLTGKGIQLTQAPDGSPLPAPIDLNALYKHKPGEGGDGGSLGATRNYDVNGMGQPAGLPRITVPIKDRAAVLSKYASTDPFPEPKDAAPEHGDMAPTPAADPVAAALTPDEHANITANLAKVADDPQAAPLATTLQTAVTAAQTRGVPRIANSAGLFGGKAVSDILEKATDRIGAGLATVAGAARDSAFVRATQNGRYRGSYEVDKAAGDAVNQLAASGESANTYAQYATRHVLQDLNPQQRSLLVDHLLDERAKAIEAAGGTPNRTSLRALTPAETQQVQTDPKMQAALMKFENGPMGTIQNLRQFVSPRLTLQQTGSGRFLSLLAKQDAAGNAVNDRAASGKPAAGMSGRGVVKGTTHARQATGTAQEYSHNLGEIMTHDLTEVNKKANLKQVYKTLLAQRDAQGNRLAYSSALKAGQALPDTITYGGKDYPAVDVKPGYRYVDKSGRIKEIAIRVPAPIAADLEDALTPPRRGNDLGAVAQQASGLATSMSLLTPAEITNHVGRLVSAVSKMPPVGTRLPQRLGEMAVPYVGPRAGALYRLFNTDMSDPANVAVLQRIMDANGGSGRPFAHEIGSSIASKVPGLSKVQNFSHDFLFSLPEGKGLSGFDLRLRVMAEKMRAAAEGNTDPQRVREFANQFGQYTSKPEKLVQSIRTIAPFAATSLPLKMTELRLMTGGAGFKNLPPKQAAALRAETLFRGTAGTILAHSLINHALSGHWPWQNAPGHETDLEAGKDKDGKPVYIGANRIDPTLERPLSTLGVPDMIADLRKPSSSAGGRIDALLKDAGRGLYNAAGSSISSPLTQFATTAATGHDPLYLTRGNTTLPTSQIATPKNGQSQALNNLRSAVGGLNPALGAVLHTDKQSRETPYQAPLWRTVQQMERLTGPILKQDAPKKGKAGRGPALQALRQQVSG